MIPYIEVRVAVVRKGKEGVGTRSHGDLVSYNQLYISEFMLIISATLSKNKIIDINTSQGGN